MNLIPPTRDILAIDTDISEIRALIATQQAQLKALYIEGLAALGEPYTDATDEEWEPIVLVDSYDSPSYLAFVKLEVLDSAYDYAKKVANGEIDDFFDGEEQ